MKGDKYKVTFRWEKKAADPAQKGTECTDYAVSIIETKDSPQDPTLLHLRQQLGPKEMPPGGCGRVGSSLPCHSQTPSEFHLLYLLLPLTHTH